MPCSRPAGRGPGRTRGVLCASAACHEGRPSAGAIFPHDGCCPQPVLSWPVCPGPGPAQAPRPAYVPAAGWLGIAVDGKAVRGAKGRTGSRSRVSFSGDNPQPVPLAKAGYLETLVAPAVDAHHRGTGARASACRRAREEAGDVQAACRGASVSAWERRLARHATCSPAGLASLLPAAVWWSASGLSRA